MFSVPSVRFAPYLLAVSLTTITFALGTLALRLGIAGLVSGAILGALWSLLLGLVAACLMRRESWRPCLANAPVASAIVASGLLIGGALMYIPLMYAALNEPSTTYATLSALMQPTIPYFIIVNSLMEALIVPFAIFLNWRAAARRPFIVVAVLLYFAMRVWTYLSYAPLRLEISQRPLSAEDVQWFKEMLAVDYRVIPIAIAHLSFILAASAPVSRQARDQGMQPSM